MSRKASSAERGPCGKGPPLHTDTLVFFRSGKEMAQHPKPPRPPTKQPRLEEVASRRGDPGSDSWDAGGGKSKFRLTQRKTIWESAAKAAPQNEHRKKKKKKRGRGDFRHRSFRAGYDKRLEESEIGRNLDGGRVLEWWFEGGINRDLVREEDRETIAPGDRWKPSQGSPRVLWGGRGRGTRGRSER